MMEINDQNCKITKKNKLVTINIDNDYDTLKTIYCHIHRVRPQDIKDTRRLSVKIMNKLADSNLEYVTICSNLLRGIKSKIC